MTRQRINLHIHSITVAGGHLSEQALSDAIRTELGMRLHGLGSTDFARQGRLVPVVDGGRVAGNENLGLSTGVGQAVARAAMGVVRR
jgi:hypothetical protein